VKGIGPSASLPSVTYVAARTAHAPTTLAAFPKIVAVTQVRSSLPVNERVIVLPTKARDHEALSDWIFTSVNVGFTPNEVKWSAVNEHTCGFDHAHVRLLMTLLLGVMMVPLISFTTIKLSSGVPSGKRAGSKYIVNSAWIFCSADPDSTEPLLIVKLINHQLI